MSFQKLFDSAVADHLERKSADRTKVLQQLFFNQDVVILNDLLPNSLKFKMEEEAVTLLNRYGKRRELHIKVTGNTPRFFTSVGRDAISNYGQYIPAFFASKPVIEYLRILNNSQEILPVPYEPEEYLINSLLATGDTHGWHWDDYSFVLVWIVEAPDPGEGGLVEYVPKAEWDQTDSMNCVKKILDTHPVNQMYVPQGHCYFMKANTTLHRISPLTDDSRRTVIVFTYASKEDLKKEISHETIEQIWGRELGTEQKQGVIIR